MLETIMKRNVLRHKQAPLWKEREQFLLHLQRQGTSRKSLVNIAGELLHIVRTLRMGELRDINLEEISEAATRWAREQRSNPRAKTYAASESYFIQVAKKWLRYHGRLKTPAPSHHPFADQLDDFIQYMTEEQGLSPASVKSHLWKASTFLRWFATRRRSLSAATLDDADEFLAMKGAAGWKRRSVKTTAQALRSFFYHAERRGWCRRQIASGIKGPIIYRYADVPEGPSWDQARLILQSTEGSRPHELRAKATLFLFAIYGLRSGEVARLLLDDFDWRAEIFTVTHSKRGGQQQYPLRRDVGEAILQYLKHARPRTACRNVFVTLRPPYRPIGGSVLYCIVRTHFDRVGVRCAKRGPHSLRHTCATQLLRQGASFKEIGDLLGHRSADHVGVYAKVDLSTLRAVADVSLGGLL
jgi:integrase/recombinase XerD